MAKHIGINKSIYRAIREDELGISRERARKLCEWRFRDRSRDHEKF